MTLHCQRTSEGEPHQVTRTTVFRSLARRSTAESDDLRLAARRRLGRPRLTATTYPHIGPGPETPPPGDYSQTLDRDQSETSPFIAANRDAGTSTSAFIQNMSALLLALDQDPAPRLLCRLGLPPKLL